MCASRLKPFSSSGSIARSRSAPRVNRFRHMQQLPVGSFRMKMILAVGVVVLGATMLTACSNDLDAMSADNIEKQYGVAGAFTDTIQVEGASLRGMLVPITLANGRQGQLFIPQRQAGDEQAVYLRDETGLHPVALKDRATRADLIKQPGIVETRTVAPAAKKRSWEKEVLIIGGGAGAGAAIGAVAGGKKGAGVGAAAGGVGGLIYDLMTRKKK